MQLMIEPKVKKNMYKTLFLTSVVKMFPDRSFKVNVIELIITTRTRRMIFKIRFKILK